MLERHRKRSRSESSSSFYSKSSRKINSSSESESSRSRRNRKEKGRKDKRKVREEKYSKETNKSRKDKKEVKKNKKLSNSDEILLKMGKVSQEIDIKYGGEDDLTPKIERKDENIENLESCDLRVEEKNINFVEHVKTQNSSNNFENNCMEKLKDISTAEQKHLEDEIESNTQLAMMSYQQVENKCEQGLELRSRLIGEDNTTRNAIEVYTGFKKINYLDIPNVHRKL